MFEDKCHYGSQSAEGWRKDCNTYWEVREHWFVFRPVFWTKWWCHVLKTWPRSLRKGSYSQGRSNFCSLLPDTDSLVLGRRCIFVCWDRRCHSRGQTPPGTGTVSLHLVSGCSSWASSFFPSRSRCLCSSCGAGRPAPWIVTAWFILISISQGSMAQFPWTYMVLYILSICGF